MGALEDSLKRPIMPGDNRHVADDALLEKSDFYVDEKRIDAWYSIHWCMNTSNWVYWVWARRLGQICTSSRNMSCSRVGAFAQRVARTIAQLEVAHGGVYFQNMKLVLGTQTKKPIRIALSELDKGKADPLHSSTQCFARFQITEDARVYGCRILHEDVGDTDVIPKPWHTHIPTNLESLLHLSTTATLSLPSTSQAKSIQRSHGESTGKRNPPTPELAPWGGGGGLGAQS
ncbi:hypothetical protein BGY98DRAFT_1142987 [Russula aff. rugulosa BPL654]|nr:hypothetical protein BGY98DRAFT_1142987 [Russula aff. rugulosa BPL654]